MYYVSKRMQNMCKMQKLIFGSFLTIFGYFQINLSPLLGGHAYSRCLLYEPKTSFEVHQESVKNWIGDDSMFVQIKTTHDSQRGLSIHEFDCLWFDCGYARCSCGE